MNYIRDIFNKNMSKTCALKTAQRNKNGLNKWKDMLCTWIGKFNIVKDANAPQIDLYRVGQK